MRQSRVVIYRDRKGEWRWRLKAGNGQIVADSAEGYTSRAHARRAWKTVTLAVARSGSEGT